MDNASEWRIYWRIILPLSAPALAVLAIFSVMWRWNEFLWPMIVLNKTETFTLQLALNSFQGERGNLIPMNPSAERVVEWNKIADQQRAAGSGRAQAAQ